jgi:hypothetical protein
VCAYAARLPGRELWRRGWVAIVVTVESSPRTSRPSDSQTNRQGVKQRIQDVHVSHSYHRVCTEKSEPSLQGLKQAFGLFPNLAATMADSPALINSFVAAFGNFTAAA